MNLIMIVLDTFRQDHVGFYHAGQAPFDEIAPCRTPNLDVFARDCVVFDNAYPEALPTMPVRLQLMTGQRTLHVRPWGALGPGDATIAWCSTSPVGSARRSSYTPGAISTVQAHQGSRPRSKTPCDAMSATSVSLLPDTAYSASPEAGLTAVRA